MTLDIAKLKAAAERAKAAAADYQSGVIDAGVFYCRAAEFHRLTDSPEQTLELIAALDAMVAAHVNMALLADVYRQAYEEARARIAELEARPLTVKLPEAATEGGRGYRKKAIWALQEACFDAGINLETGGEA